MASVRFDFLPPVDENIVALRIFEASNKDGPFVQIDRTTEVGIYPNYITTYKTDEATSQSDWFYIAWEDDAGSIGPGSAPIKGGVASLVAQVVDRVLQRDRSLDRSVITQEAEAAIQFFLGDNVDPYDLTLTTTYRQLNGLVYLVLARALMSLTSSGVDDAVTLSLVSIKPTTSSDSKDLDRLMQLANDELGLNVSRVLQMRLVRRHHRHVWEYVAA